jgi:hypothetical protein
MSQDQAAAAAAAPEYDTSLQNTPMRLRGFVGAARAAGDGDRPEIHEARRRRAKP